MEKQKRGRGRPPKAEAVDRPLVLTLGRKREKLEIELTTTTREDLEEYLSWVEECEPEIDTGELWFKTFEYAITTLLKSDKKWRGRLRETRGAKVKKDDAPPSPGDITHQPESIATHSRTASGTGQPNQIPGDAEKSAPPPATAHVAPAVPSLPAPGQARDQKKAG
jgi:hypothetical protein